MVHVACVTVQTKERLHYTTELHSPSKEQEEVDYDENDCGDYTTPMLRTDDLMRISKVCKDQYYFHACDEDLRSNVNFSIIAVHCRRNA